MSDSQANEGPRVIQRPIEDVKRYARRRYALFIAHLVVGAAFLFAMIAGASSVVSREAKSIAGPNAFLLTVFFYFAGFSLAYLVVSLPLTFYRGHILEHQFGLSTQTFGRWAGRRIKKWIFSFVVVTPLVLAFYALLRRWPVMWWLPASVLWIAFTYILTKFAPQILIPIFYKLEEIKDEKLSARLTNLATKAGICLLGVYRIDLSRETKKANAAVVGLGSTRRVVLGDTLLAEFTHTEIAAVFAHELGHIVHRHLIKGFALAGLLCVGSLYAGSLVLHHAAAALDIRPLFSSIPNAVSNPETLPILVAVLAVIQFVVLPFEKWYSRRRELKSDEYALRATGDRGAFISAMKKLGAMNLADVNPNKLAEIFLFSHPPILKRIRFAQKFGLSNT